MSLIVGVTFALAYPLSTVGRLGGRASCWEYFYNYEACCDRSLWGLEGNPTCFDTKASRDYCCVPAFTADTCIEHYARLVRDEKNSAYPLGRALEVLACFTLHQRKRDARLALQRAARIAAGLPGYCKRRALAVVALEYHRVSGLSFADARVEVGDAHNSSAVADVFGALSPQRAAHCVSGGCMSPTGAELRECARVRRNYPRIRGGWSAWGHDGSTRIGGTLWCLCAREDVRVVVDLGAHLGSGSTLTAAHAVNKTGGSIYAFELEDKYLSSVYRNIEMFENRVSIINKDVSLALPRLCTHDLKAVDLVIFDPSDMEPDSVWTLAKTVLEFCAPRFWVISNIQLEDAAKALEHVLSNGYRVVLHDLSPTLASKGHLIQEFVIVSAEASETIA